MQVTQPLPNECSCMQGVYVKREGAPSALDLLGGVIAEAPAALASSGAEPSSDKPRQNGHASSHAPQSSAKPAHAAHDRDATYQVLTKTLPAAGIIPSGGMPLSNGSMAESNPAAAEQPDPLASGTTEVGPDPHASEGQHDHRAQPSSSASPGTVLAGRSPPLAQAGRAAAQTGRRVVGPAAPPAQLLAAAAEAAEQVCSPPCVLALLFCMLVCWAPPQRMHMCALHLPPDACGRAADRLHASIVRPAHAQASFSRRAKHVQARPRFINSPVRCRCWQRARWMICSSGQSHQRLGPRQMQLPGMCAVLKSYAY